VRLECTSVKRSTYSSVTGYFVILELQDHNCRTMSHSRKLLTEITLLVSWLLSQAIRRLSVPHPRTDGLGLLLSHHRFTSA
jgi:hypothetical protein